MMAFLKRQPWIVLLLLSLISSSFISTSHGGGIAISWGQNNGDGTLTNTCSTGNYQVVNIAYLVDFGCKKTPALSLAGNCGPGNPCTKLQGDIEYCQSQQGVKVFLSIGGPTSSYSLCSAQDAKDVANYLYTNFLSGQAGPLGAVALDGIDFDIQTGTNRFWDNLASELDDLRQINRFFYLSATPQCFIPDPFLHSAIRTGLFDNVYVRFYNNPLCQYSSNDTTALLFKSWGKWIGLIRPNNYLFMGLPASPDGANGYIPPDVMVKDVLPFIKRSPNYGGVMLWDRARDLQTSYSKKIKPAVSFAALQSVTAISDAISECVSAALHHTVPKPKPL